MKKFHNNSGIVSLLFQMVLIIFVSNPAIYSQEINGLQVSFWNVENLFDLDNETQMGHIELSRASDIVLVVPATANLLAKMAGGMADDLATTLLLATDKKVFDPNDLTEWRKFLRVLLDAYN